MTHMIGHFVRAAALSCSLVFFVVSCGDSVEEVAVSSVQLNQSSAALTEGETLTLTATVLPSNADDKTVTWQSAPESVASVNHNGVVTALAEGTATVTASAGGKSASCTITVSKKEEVIIEVASLELDRTSLTLAIGRSTTLTATVKPDDATDKTVTWTASPESVATVSNGTVTAVAEGTATVFAIAGGRSATCIVTVVETIEVASVELDETALSLVEGESATLTAIVLPDDATDKTVTWSSSDESVATVDENGVVTAVAEGTATITAEAGGQSASCTVSVTPAFIAVESVTLDEETLSLVEGESATLTAIVEPENATDKAVTWSSSDESVATVDENGVVTAVAEGTATITAEAGGQSASCTVSVSPAPAA